MPQALMRMMKGYNNQPIAVMLMMLVCYILPVNLQLTVQLENVENVDSVP